MRMVTAVQLATFVSEATRLGYEAVQHHIRILREAEILSPSLRGRGAAPLGVRDAALLTMACLASNLSKDSAATIADLRGLRPARPTYLTLSPVVDEAASPGLSMVCASAGLLEAVEAILALLGAGALFSRDDRIAPDGDFLQIEVESFLEDRYRARAARIEAGNARLYRLRMTFDSPDFRSVDRDRRWRRGSAGSQYVAPVRRDSYGLQTIEEIAMKVVQASSATAPDAAIPRSTP